MCIFMQRNVCHFLRSPPDSGQERVNNSWGDKRGKMQTDSTDQKNKTIFHVLRQPCPRFTFTKTVNVLISENPQVLIVFSVSCH